MGKEKQGMDVTRMVVVIDGRWNPSALYARIESTGLPILGVKPMDCGRCTLSFEEPLTREAVSMLQRDIVSFFKSDLPETPQNGTRQVPKEQRRTTRFVKKIPYMRRHI